MRALLAVTALTILAALPAAARRHDPEKLPVTHIRDLHYGDVLFYYYQQDHDFEAITRLTAYQHWGLVPHHADESQLLLGGLYLSFGMNNEAGRLFETLLTQDVPTGVRNRAWFYLAQVWYTRGYLDKSEAALRKINGKLSPELEAQKEHLFANVLMHEGRFDEAISLLTAWHGAQDWTAYARFNLGVALVRQGKLADADPFLTSVGSMYAERNEMLALKDRANLALGFAYLQASQPAKGLTALQRVRLNGPYSNKALLGAGWAYAALGDYQRALSPWLELRDRNLLDSAVQESYLAVPYAYGKLAASSQSAEYYESAVKSYDSESTHLDEAIVRIRGGSLLNDLAVSEKDGNHGWFWQLRKVPDAPEARYLYTVMAGHDFQEGLKSYRDLVSMWGELDRWAGSMDAFGDMIDTRQRAYAERLPRADALLASGVPEHLQQRRDDIERRLSAIEGAHDVASLGTPEEGSQWARLQRLESALAGLPVNQENGALRERLRLLKGVLYFRLNDTFSARMWQQRRTLKDLDLVLREAQSRWIRVDRARRSVPTNTSEFGARVAALKQRIDALQTRLAVTQGKQSDLLANLAVNELEAQKQRLSTYQVQARFALATMYDRAANSDAHTEQTAPPGPRDSPSGEAAPPPADTSAVAAPPQITAPAPAPAPAPEIPK